MDERKTGSVDPLLDSIEARVDQIRHALNHAAIELHLKLADIELNPDALDGNVRIEYEKIGKGLLDIADLSESIATSITKDTVEHEETQPGFLSEEVEAFRSQINQAAGREVLPDPLTEDKLIELFDVYAKSLKKPGYAPLQLVRLKAMLQGKSPKDIKSETGERVDILQRLRATAAKVIARELNALMDAPELDSDRFSPVAVEAFRKQINRAAGYEILPTPLDEKKIYEILDLYERAHKPRTSIDLQSDRFIALLEGKRPETIAKETGKRVDNLSGLLATAAGIIAYNLDLELKPKSKFSPEQLEIFRQQINQAAGQEVLPDPLTDGKALELLDVYAKNHKTRLSIDLQVQRVTGVLRGDRPRDIERNTNAPIGNLQKIKLKAAETIARALVSQLVQDSSVSTNELVTEHESNPSVQDTAPPILPEDPSEKVIEDAPVESTAPPQPTEEMSTIDSRETPQEINSDKDPDTYQILTETINKLVEQGILQKTHEIPLQKHLGIINEKMDGKEAAFAAEGCEVIEKKLTKLQDMARSKRLEWRVDNAPTDQQIIEVHKLLGSRQNSISPIPKHRLVNEYHAHLAKIAPENVPSAVIWNKVAMYDAFLDQAIYVVFEWVLDPRYRLLHPRPSK